MRRADRTRQLNLQFRPLCRDCSWLGSRLSLRSLNLRHTRHLLNRNLPPNKFLDRLEIRHFIRITKRNSRPAGAGTRGSANTVNIRFRLVGQIVIEHMADPIHVDPARGDIRRDQQWSFASAEIIRARCRAFWLLFPWNASLRCRWSAEPNQTVGTVLGARVKIIAREIGSSLTSSRAQ